MNSDDDDTQDDLTREYRRASAGHAGRPDQATRAAILAEARAAARRRLPAANDSRMWWRAAASVAVVGVGVLLWRQVDREASPAPAPAPAMSARASAESAAVADVADVAADSTAQSRSLPASAALAQAASPPAAKAAGRAAGNAAESARATSAALDATSSGLARGESRNVADLDLLRTQFPAEYASSSPPRALWVLKDAEGKVLRRGALGDNEDFAAVSPGLTRDFPDQRIGPWKVTPVTNAQGVELQLGVALLQ